MTIAEFRLIPIEEIGAHKYVAIIGSRSIKSDNDTMSFIRDLACRLCYERKCKVVSGGAYGPDQAGMEGALKIPLHSLDPIIPLSSKNARKITPVLKGLVAQQSVMVDEIECCFTADRLIVFYPDFKDGYAAYKYFERDEKIARVGDIVIAFWDGSSRGTKKTIDYAIQQEKQALVVKC